MESVGHVVVPLRVGGKKMKKRRELDALVAHSIAKRACNSGKKQAGNGINSQDQLLSQSTDDQEDSTWSKVPITTTRCRTKRYSCLRTCGPIMFSLSIFILFGFMYWLYFDLRQQISDHRIRIEQVSATSQLLPDALQKWHMVTKSLEQNQTSINGKLIEIHSSLLNFEKELTKIKDDVTKNNGNSDNGKFTVLENNVATFGAKIKDLTINLNEMKNFLHKIQDYDNENKLNLTKLTAELELFTHNYTVSYDFNFETIQAMINNISNGFSMGLKNLSFQVSVINDTLSQKTNGLDDDIRSLKPKVDILADNFANMSSHVTSIEEDWSKYKQNAKHLVENNVQINSEIIQLKNNTGRLSTTVKQMEENIKLTKKTQQFLQQVEQIQQQTVTLTVAPPTNLPSNNNNNNNNNINNNNSNNNNNPTVGKLSLSPLDTESSKLESLINKSIDVEQVGQLSGVVTSATTVTITDRNGNDKIVSSTQSTSSPLLDLPSLRALTNKLKLESNNDQKEQQQQQQLRQPLQSNPPLPLPPANNVTLNK